MTKVKDGSAKSVPTRLKIYRLLGAGVLLLVVCGALSLPFAYESQTLWYKVGRDKTTLLAGQLVGLLAAVLLCVQVILAARGQFLKEILGIAALMRWHQKNGIIIAVFAISHALLILVPEGITNLPIGTRYWPEMVGMLLFCIILLMVISAIFRQKLGFDYKRWRSVHKLLGYLAVILVSVHVLFVCDSFEHTIPRVSLLTIVGIVAVTVILSNKATKQPTG